MADIKLTQAQVDAIPVLVKQAAQAGLIVRKFNGTDWIRLTYVSVDGSGNWNIAYDRIVLDDRKRESVLAQVALDKIREALRDEVTNGTLTLANGTTLFSYVSTALLGLEIGWLRESRMLCNNLATTAQFTAGRKNFMLARIDEAIALL